MVEKTGDTNVKQFAREFIDFLNTITGEGADKAYGMGIYSSSLFSLRDKVSNLNNMRYPILHCPRGLSWYELQTDGIYQGTYVEFDPGCKVYLTKFDVIASEGKGEISYKRVAIYPRNPSRSATDIDLPIIKSHFVAWKDLYNCSEKSESA